MKRKKITLFVKGSDLLPLQSSAVGLMFECAPDGETYQYYPHAIALKKLIGEFRETKANAFQLARKLLADEPECRGIQQLSVFEELVIRELQRAYHLLHLHAFLIENGFTQCHFTGSTHFAEGLQCLVAYLNSNLVVTVSDTSRKNIPLVSIKRSFKRLSASGFSTRTLSQEWEQVLERIDPYHRRHRIGVNKNSAIPGAIWFYTTAYTYTRIGLIYEPYFPQPFHYLVENPLKGGVPLTAVDRSYTSVYQFGNSGMEPSASEALLAEGVIRSHLQSVVLSRNEAAAFQLLLSSSYMHVFFNHHLPKGLFLSALFEHWASLTTPAALVVGNPIFEAYGLHVARRHNIQTILLQHGILGDFCQFSDPPVDHYIVRGEFFKNFLAAVPRSRALVLNPPGMDRGASQVTDQRKAILFLTAAHEAQEFHHITDLEGILGVLLHVASEQKCELIVRVHPLEDIGYYRDIMLRLMRNNRNEFKVTYSQGAGLDALLERSAVAVMYSSTVFLDCLRYRVPIVSFAWHDFSYKEQIEEYSVFYFARHLEEFRELLKKSLKGELAPYSKNATPFLADTPAEMLYTALAGLTAFGLLTK